MLLASAVVQVPPSAASASKTDGRENSMGSIALFRGSARQGVRAYGFRFFRHEKDLAGGGPVPRRASLLLGVSAIYSRKISGYVSEPAKKNIRPKIRLEAD